MMWLDIPLDVATAIITALAINASVDFAIYYVIAYMDALTKTDRDNAIILTMKGKGEIIINDIVLNAACFSPLIASSFTPISRLGWMMVVMIIACGIGSLVVMASLLRVAVDFSFKGKIASMMGWIKTLGGKNEKIYYNHPCLVAVPVRNRLGWGY
jgi:predicted RND superfamily exporter protein